MVKFIVGDIGGTNSRLELWEIKTDSPGEPQETLLGQRVYSSKKVSHLTVLLKSFIQQFVGDTDWPRACCLAVAGPVRANTSQITNLNWVLDGDQMAKQLEIPNFIIVNDFVGTGYGLLSLSTDDVVVLNPITPTPAAVKACVGAGTGLGETFLTWNGQEYDTWPAEGGHSDFAPRDEEEFKLMEFIKTKFRIDRVSVERVVSGSAIPIIYEFFKTQYPDEVCNEVEERIRNEDPGMVVAESAKSGVCNLCIRSLRLFVSAYGSECGNLALKTLSFGGLYIAGGIAMKILWSIEADSTFWNAFVNKGRMKPLLENMPVFIVKPESVGLLGAKVVCRRSLRKEGFSVKGELESFELSVPNKMDESQRANFRSSFNETKTTYQDIARACRIEEQEGDGKTTLRVSDLRMAAFLGGVTASVVTLTAVLCLTVLSRSKSP